MIRRLLSNGFSSSLFFVMITTLVYPQVGRTQNSDLKNLRLEDVRISAQSTERVFSQLSILHGVPVGLEISPNDTEFHSYSIDFKGGALPELMAEIIAQNKLYNWQITEGVVYVYPIDQNRDNQLKELVETNVSRFKIKKGTSSWSLVNALISVPEIQKVLTTNTLVYRPRSFSGGYIPQLGRNFTRDVSNQTLSSILNTVVKESPTAKFWVIKKHVDNPLEFIISVSARHEDLPANNLKFPNSEH